MAMTSSEPILEALTFCLEESGIAESTTAATNSTIHKLTQKVFCTNLKVYCPFADCSSEFVSVNSKEGRDEVLKHLLVVHNFVIGDIGHIADLHRYLIHLKERFIVCPIEDLCSAFWMDEPMTDSESLGISHSKAPQGEITETRVKYFMISDVLPEDKELRNKLWAERLENAIEVNRLEREQTDFSRQCLFCKLVLTINRTNLFEHMATDHCFYMGQPDNLVFVDELLTCLNNSLNSQICIYCGKTFKDKTVMREHMRKKMHKKINPANPVYDRFYLINYLEPGKNWKTFEEEEPEDDRNETEWIEKNESTTSVVCLLCSYQSTKFEFILSHMVTEHSFDFENTVCNFDFYQKVKLVNFIRRSIHQSTCFYCSMKFLEKGSLISHVRHHFKDNHEFPPFDVWNQPEYFFPTYENDQFLILLDHNENDEGMDTQKNNLVIPEDMACSQFTD